MSFTSNESINTTNSNPNPNPDPNQPRIYIGGLEQFYQDSGANRSEPLETFEWMGTQQILNLNDQWTKDANGDPCPATFGTKSDRHYYENCRDAIAKVEGAREYLKNYTTPPGARPFDDEIGKQFQLSNRHSGGSWSGILWSYRQILNDWDGWVLAYKRDNAKAIYLEVFPRSMVVDFYHEIKNFMNKDGTQNMNYHFATRENIQRIINKAATYGLYNKTLVEIYAITKQVYEENLVIIQKEHSAWEEEEHQSLMECLEFHFEHPVRWLDTPHGSHLKPISPKYITERAMEEMEKLHPGYQSHIEGVKSACVFFYTTFLARFINTKDAALAKYGIN